MAKYDKKTMEADSSTESLIEISAGDFKGGAEESNSYSSSESLKQIAAGDFNESHSDSSSGSYSDSSSGSYSDSSSESLKEISAQEFVDGSRSSSRSKVRVNDCQNLNLFACVELIRNEHIEIDIKEDEVQKEEIDMLIEANVSDSEKEEDETEVSLEDDKSDEKVENDLKVEENSKEIDEFDKKVGIVFEELESIPKGVETSFGEACSKLQRCYMSLSRMLSEGHSPLLDKLAKQAFRGTQTLYSAYSSRGLKHMDLNKELLSRVLLNVKNQSYICLTEEQVKEIDARIHSLSSETAGKSKKDPKISSFIGLNSSGESLLETPTNSRTIKVDLNPLLNLHEDYDEDSLPSPTYNHAPSLPALKPVEYEAQRAPIPAQTMSTVPKNANENEYEIHPYVIDAFKAVSSYHQKHVKDPSVDVSQLLSPTPSDDGTDDKDDTCVEVSSSLVVTSAKIAGPVSSSIHTNCDMGISQMTPTMPTEHNTDICHNSKAKSLGRSRDRRHEFMDPDIPQNGNTTERKTVDELVLKEHNVKRQSSSIPQNGNTSKHKAVDDLVLKNHNVKRQSSSISQNGSTRKHMAVNDHVLEEHAVKRQRNGSVKLKDDQAPLGGNKWIEDNLSHINKINQLHDNINGLNVGSASSVLSSPVCALPSPSGVKDSEVNPTISVQLVKEQSSLEAMDQENAAVQVVNGSFNALPATLHTEKKLFTNPRVHVQTSSMNDTEKSRMKPRDPRRIVIDVVKKCKNPVSRPAKPTVSQPPKPRNKMGNSVTPRLTEEVQSVSLPSQSIVTHNSLSQYKNNPDKVLGSSTSTVTQKPELATGMEDVLSGYDEQRKVDIKKERARRIAEQNKMFAARKLCLVLDLDHTLLNSAMFGEIDPLHEELLRKREAHDKTQEERHLYRLPHMGMWTKLRPGVRNFLGKASKLYELHVYTMGNKIYANEMTKILDPQGTLFSGRVISGGGDDENTGAEDRVTKIKDLGGVLGMESSVVIIDDTVRVWPHHKLNLIAVERYMYFPSSRRQFGLNGPSLLELNRDEMPECGTLASSLAVIERVHQNFFSHQSLDEVDVRTILAIEQRKILEGCKILFSRVFPLAEANPHLHPLWKTAEQFGAECTNEIDEHVTHVVAISKGTNKVNWALATGRFVVHPGWVEASALLYRRAKEQDFAVKR